MSALDVPEAGAKFLLSRSFTSIESANRYLFPDESQSHDPFLFDRMEEAVDCVRKASAVGKKVLIHGDYDVDGIAGTALLYLYLKSLFPEVFRFLPDRRKDGYGLAGRAVNWALKNDIGLVITIDCGTSDGEFVSKLESAGIAAIICDHHEFPFDGELSGIVLNPIRDSYPFESLSGAGVAFKLAQALRLGGVHGDVEPEELIDLAALATVSDLVPLIDENRYIVREGLKLMNLAPRVGLETLKRMSGTHSPEIDTKCISFRLAPRLNAPGRTSQAKPSLELLCTSSDREAEELAGILEKENERRRNLTALVQKNVMQRIEEAGDIRERGGFVLASGEWDEGVLGIAASRVVETFGKPTVLISNKGEFAKGSGRSVPGVHLKEQLDECKEYLLRYGGHSQAVGLTIRSSLLHDFMITLSKRLDESARLLPEKPFLNIDSEICLEECSMQLLEFLDTCQPFGRGNREPVWKLSRLFVMDETRVVGNDHLKIHFKDQKGTEGEGIFFNAGHIDPASIQGKLIDLAVTLRKGNYLDKIYPEIRVLDIRYCE